LLRNQEELCQITLITYGQAYPSAEGERERFHIGIEELDLEPSIGDRSGLSNQLIQALLGDRAVALVVDVSSMARARRPSIDQHSKRNGSSASGGSHDEVEIARMKLVCDPPASSVRHSRLCLQRPFTGKRPLVEAQARRNGIDVARIHRAAARRREILRQLDDLLDWTDDYWAAWRAETLNLIRQWLEREF
jgi:hypothetical protein